MFRRGRKFSDKLLIDKAKTRVLLFGIIFRLILPDRQRWIDFSNVSFYAIHSIRTGACDIFFTNENCGYSLPMNSTIDAKQLINTQALSLMKKSKQLTAIFKFFMPYSCPCCLFFNGCGAVTPQLRRNLTAVEYMGLPLID